MARINNAQTTIDTNVTPGFITSDAVHSTERTSGIRVPSLASCRTIILLNALLALWVSTGSAQAAAWVSSADEPAAVQTTATDSGQSLWRSTSLNALSAELAQTDTTPTTIVLSEAQAEEMAAPSPVAIPVALSAGFDPTAISQPSSFLVLTMCGLTVMMASRLRLICRNHPALLPQPCVVQPFGR
jgi:hypothetical protein